MPFRDPERRKAYVKANKAKIDKDHKKWLANNPKRVKANRKRYYKENRTRELKQNKLFYLKRYGITQAQFERMLIEQGGRCKVCFKPMIGPREPQVDHNHKTGKARGLLCSPCNLGLGCFKDSKETLARAIAYLESYEPTQYEDYPSRK